MSKGRVLMAMSGGIDSSVAAILLLEQGYELVGVTFRTFDSIKPSCMAKEKGCCSVESIMDAREFAKRLGFEHRIVDFRDTFRKYVISDFVNEYRQGRTPNPCVLCNSHIKWGVLMNEADKFDCQYIATGHYAGITEKNGHYFLRKAIDTHKDQTYFLWMLTEENLKRTIFPLGGMTKTEVRQTALRHGFERLSKKSESQEICFIPNNDYRSFLQSEGVEQNEGLFTDKNGNILGKHQGYSNFTIGQRKGLGVALGYPAFVTKIDASTNTVSLGVKEDLFQTDVCMNHFTFRGDSQKHVMAQIRYRSQPSDAVLLSENLTGKEAVLRFTNPVWAVTPGQSVVIYQDDLLVGGGIIA